MRRRRGQALLSAAAALALGTGGSALAAPAPGPNLVVNPGFEASALETGPVAPGSLPQPVLPTGWVFEGATLLFDHSPHQARSGKRGAAISGAVGGRQVCDASSGSYVCVPNPATFVTDHVDFLTDDYYSVRPFWRTADPVRVTAGKKYVFSVYANRPSLDPNAQVLGEGAETKVRWLGADGRTVAVTKGPAHLAGPKRHLGWKQVSATLVAPAGATGAVLMLGHSDYTTTSGQVAFDDVHFGLVTK